jgi:hypothetical protein
VKNGSSSSIVDILNALPSFASGGVFAISSFASEFSSVIGSFGYSSRFIGPPS